MPIVIKKKKPVHGILVTPKLSPPDPDIAMILKAMMRTLAWRDHVASMKSSEGVQ
jgi:hypothetical protein